MSEHPFYPNPSALNSCNVCGLEKRFHYISATGMTLRQGVVLAWDVCRQEKPSWNRPVMLFCKDPGYYMRIAKRGDDLNGSALIVVLPMRRYEFGNLEYPEARALIQKLTCRALLID